MVIPVKEVYRPKSMIRKKVKMQESNRGQIRVMPYAAPEEAMVVMLPVPILYPIRKSPGATEARKRAIFLWIFNAKED
jgi:hypothetical protein